MWFGLGLYGITEFGLECHYGYTRAMILRRRRGFLNRAGFGILRFAFACRIELVQLCSGKTEQSSVITKNGNESSSGFYSFCFTLHYFKQSVLKVVLGSNSSYVSLSVLAIMQRKKSVLEVQWHIVRAGLLLESACSWSSS